MVVPGRVLYADGAVTWLARGSSLFRSEDCGLSWQRSAIVPLGFTERIMCSTRLTRRLARAGIHHYLSGTIADVAIAGRYVFRRARGDQAFERVGVLHGSRPLSIASDGRSIFYGEYRGNPERSAVHVWASEDWGLSWHAAWRFERVRHVHGVHYDPFTNMLWVTTGDDDREAGIWVTRDRFRTLDLVAAGSQQTRAVALCFSATHVYFGSDTPLEQNHLYRIDRCSGQIEKLQAVGSSVFYGCRAGSWLFFSTAAEPSKVNTAKRVEVWCTPDGERWSLLRTFTKDCWPHRLFQYGQVLFPLGPGDDRYVFFSAFGTDHDQRTFRLELADVPRLLEASSKAEEATIRVS